MRHTGTNGGKRNRGERGAALLLVLLLLAALFMFAAAVQFSALLTWLTVRNEIRHVQATALLDGRYLQARLLLEDAYAAEGRLPGQVLLPSGTHWYADHDSGSGILHVDNPGPGRLGMRLHVRTDGGRLAFERIE